MKVNVKKGLVGAGMVLIPGIFIAAGSEDKGKVLSNILATSLLAGIISAAVDEAVDFTDNLIEKQKENSENYSLFYII